MKNAIGIIIHPHRTFQSFKEANTLKLARSSDIILFITGFLGGLTLGLKESPHFLDLLGIAGFIIILLVGSMLAGGMMWLSGTLTGYLLAFTGKKLGATCCRIRMKSVLAYSVLPLLILLLIQLGNSFLFYFRGSESHLLYMKSMLNIVSFIYLFILLFYGTKIVHDLDVKRTFINIFPALLIGGLLSVILIIFTSLF